MRALLAIVLAVLQASAFEYGLQPEKVNENVYCFFGKPEVMNTANNGNMVNSCFVDLGHAWLVIDPGPTFAYAQEAWGKITAIKKMPAVSVINTHVHDDHWLGNGFYIAQGVDVMGSAVFSEEVNPNAVTRMEQRISKEAYAKTTPKLPTILLEQKNTLQLHVNGTEVRLIMVDGKAHTSGDILVYLPKMQTLFGGDLVFNDRILSLRDGDINGWIAALEMVKEMPLKYIIGGHGVAVNADAVDQTYDYLVELRREVREAIDNGEGIESAVKTVKMEKFSSIALYKEMHARNVETAYRMLEWSDE